MSPPPFPRTVRRLSSASAPPPSTAAANETSLLRSNLTLLVSRRSLDHALCRQTLSSLSPHRFDCLLDEIHPSIKPKPALHFFSFAGDACGFRFTVRSYCRLVHSLLRSNLAVPARLLLIRLIDDPDRAFPEIVSALADTDEPPSGALDLLVHVCCTQFKSNGLNLSMTAFLTLINRGLCPSLKTCNILLSSLIRANRPDDAQNVFALMRRYVSPDAYSYTPLIDSLCKNREVEEAIGLFLEMENSGIYPTVVTYNALIDGLWKVGMLDEAFKLKEKMVGSSANPSIVTYNVLINGLVKLDRFGEVRYYYEGNGRKGGEQRRIRRGGGFEGESRVRPKIELSSSFVRR